ncbi:hypothetical protein M422DRAFT_261189 [Sphaerobolus stellatus SS14]|uniref:Uncharacterized protein n=1 Tax=Sphaerobolus stellatus (strain SS14) TaxID=990650 RepID=A0A0C9VGI6_SPHS4|nr:hypothetical protein M422DRAFT_261189 [Sphaerobolus stellatus SS14]
MVYKINDIKSNQVEYSAKNPEDDLYQHLSVLSKDLGKGRFLVDVFDIGCGRPRATTLPHQPKQRLRMTSGIDGSVEAIKNQPPLSKDSEWTACVQRIEELPKCNQDPGFIVTTCPLPESGRVQIEIEFEFEWKFSISDRKWTCHHVHTNTKDSGHRFKPGIKAAEFQLGTEDRNQAEFVVTKECNLKDKFYADRE